LFKNLILKDLESDQKLDKILNRINLMKETELEKLNSILSIRKVLSSSPSIKLNKSDLAKVGMD
jgi:CHASE3 domain sensor protein